MHEGCLSFSSQCSRVVSLLAVFRGKAVKNTALCVLQENTRAVVPPCLCAVRSWPFVGVCSPRLQHPVSGSSGCSCSRLFSWRHCSFWRRKPTQCPTKGPHSIENFTFLLTSRDFLTGMEEVLHLECRLAAIKQFIFTQCMKSSVLPADCKLPSWFPAAPTIVSDTRLCRFALCMLPAK